MGQQPQKEALKDGDVVLLHYTGRTADGQVFETTKKKDDGEPVAVVLGSGTLLPALEKAVRGMREGEARTLRLAAADAFGPRSADAVRMVPLKAFRERNLNPVPGMVVEINDARGRVQAVSGGRVRVDFNHPLAGKEVVFEVRLEKVLTQQREKIVAFAKRFFPSLGEEERPFTLQEGVLTLRLSGRRTLAMAEAKAGFAVHALRYAGVERVVFEESLEKGDLKGSQASRA